MENQASSFVPQKLMKSRPHQLGMAESHPAEIAVRVQLARVQLLDAGAQLQRDEGTGDFAKQGAKFRSTPTLSNFSHSFCSSAGILPARQTSVVSSVVHMQTRALGKRFGSQLRPLGIRKRFFFLTGTGAGRHCSACRWRRSRCRPLLPRRLRTISSGWVRFCSRSFRGTY